MPTASTTTALTTSYLLIGAGPGIITLEVGAVAKIHFATSAPAANADFHTLHRDGRSWAQVPSGLNAYAKKTDPGGTKTVKITYAGA